MSYEIAGVVLYMVLLCATTIAGIVIGKRKIRKSEHELDFADGFSFGKLKVVR